MRTLFFIPVFLFVLLTSVTSSYACEGHEHTQVGDLIVGKPWARESIGAAKAGVAYMVIKNEGGVADKLLSISSKAAGHVAIHTNIEEDGVMKMRPVHDLVIPAYNKVALKPGGLHVMLMKLAAPLTTDAPVMMTLTFEHAGEMMLTVPVVSKDDEAKMMHHGKQCSMMQGEESHEMDHESMDHESMDHDDEGMDHEMHDDEES